METDAANRKSSKYLCWTCVTEFFLSQCAGYTPVTLLKRDSDTDASC